MSKQFVIYGVFISLVVAYGVLMGSRLLSAKWKREKFEAEDAAEEKETFEAEKNLEKNLFIINSFEEAHGRKITTDQLKHFSKMFSMSDMTKKEMKTRIENFTTTDEEDDDAAETYESYADHKAEIAKEISSIAEKMNALAKKMVEMQPSVAVTTTKKVPAVAQKSASKDKKSVEAFTPFAVANKFVL